MRAGSWEFRPGGWPTLATVFAIPLLAALGFWQLDRAEQKEALHRIYLERSTGEPFDINRAGAERAQSEFMQYRRVHVRGSFAPAASYLLDNQVHAGSPGYFVYTLVKLLGEDTGVMVNRGWIPAGIDRNMAPAFASPLEETEFIGLAKPPGGPGLTLAESLPEELAPGLYRVQRIDIDAIATAQRRPLLPYEVRLEPPAPPGFIRDWTVPGSGRERHLGYAFQWFALAGLVTLIYVFVNLRRRGAVP